MNVNPHDLAPTVAASLELLRWLGATPRLLYHGRVVADVVTCLASELARLGLQIEPTFVAVGAALHDAGKIVHPRELDGPGHEHEASGEQLLLLAGVPPALARIARTHGAAEGDELSFEELLVIAADDLWKGTARDWVQRRIVTVVATQLKVELWRAFLLVDPIFEGIAAGATARLADARQLVGPRKGC